MGILSPTHIELTRSGMPVVRDYATAKLIEANVVPMRGRKTECKPLGIRRKSEMRIAKVGTEYHIIYYNSVVLRFLKNKKIFIQLDRDGVTLRNLLGDILGGYTSLSYGQNIPWLYNWNCNVKPQQLSMEEPTEIKLNAEGHWVSINPVQVGRLTVDRKTTSAIRKEYAPALKYIKGVMKLMVDDEGRLNLKTPPQQKYKSSLAYEYTNTLKHNTDIEKLYNVFNIMMCSTETTFYRYKGSNYYVFCLLPARVLQRIYKHIYAYEYVVNKRALKLTVVETAGAKDVYGRLVKQMQLSKEKAIF